MTESVELPVTLVDEAGQILAGPCQTVELYPHVALRFRGGVLFVYSPWRASLDRTIVASESESIEKLPAMAVHASIKQFETRGPYHDLAVVFDNGLLLETFGESAQYEHWEVGSIVDRRQLIAGPGQHSQCRGLDAAEGNGMGIRD